MVEQYKLIICIRFIYGDSKCYYLQSKMAYIEMFDFLLVPKWWSLGVYLLELMIKA